MTTTAAATLPLTTIFSAPASCFSVLTASLGAIILGNNSDCVPSGAGIFERTYAFSPGFDCPSSYITALTTQNTIGTATEYRAICCPELDGIALLSGLTFSYHSGTESATFYPWYHTLGCTAAFTQPETLTVFNNGTTTFSYVNHDGWGGINAHSVQIAWQISDLPRVSATSTSNSLPSGSTIPIPNNSPTLSPTPTSSNLPTVSTSPSISSGSNSDLPTSSKVVIGVLAPFAALGLLFIAILFAKRRRQMRSRSGLGGSGDQQKSLPDGPGIYIGG